MNSRIDRNENGLFPVLAVALTIVVLGGIYGLSTVLGASFGAVAKTLWALVIATTFAGGMLYFLKESDLELTIGATWLVAAWPSLWPTFNSIANGGNDSETYFHPMQSSILDSAWFQWGVEIALIALLVMAVWRWTKR